MRTRIPALAAGLLAGLGLALAGCDSNGTNAGLTNGPPPSAREKAGVRDDLPGAITNGDSAAARDTTTGGSNAGTVAPAGGTAQAQPEQPAKDGTAAADSVKANPPTKTGGASPKDAGGSNSSKSP